MSLISFCPVCSKSVSVPDAPPASKVRCPLCRAEFELQAALDLAPPMLEILESPITADIDFTEAAGNNAATQAPAAMALAGGGLEEEVSFSDELIFDAPGAEDAELDTEEPDTELEGDPPALDDLMGEPFTDPEELDLHEDLTDESPFGLDGPMMIDELAPAESAPIEFSEETAPTGISAVSSAAKRRKREPSFLGTMIPIIGGALVAIPLALYVVIWIRGPAGDVAGIAQFLPKWMLPSEFSKPPMAVLTPMSSNPTPSDIEEVKQAANSDIPELSTTDNGSSETKLPFASADEKPTASVPDSPEKLASDLANEASSVDPLIPTEPKEPAAEATDTPEEEMPDESASKPETGDAEDFASIDEATEEFPTEKVEATAEVGPKELISYTAADLDGILGEVNQLRASLADANELDQSARKKLKKQYYRKLYRLGEIVTFATDADETTASVAQLLADLSADSGKLNEIGKAGAQWLSLDSAKRGDDKGILLAGTIQEIAKSGNMHRVRILTMGDQTPVSIYSPTEPSFAQGDTVLVLGSIVTNPQESLHNFDDDETVVIWHGLSVKAGE